MSHRREVTVRARFARVGKVANEPIELCIPDDERVVGVQTPDNTGAFVLVWTVKYGGLVNATSDAG